MLTFTSFPIDTMNHESVVQYQCSMCTFNLHSPYFSSYIRVLVCTLDAVENVSSFWVVTVHRRILQGKTRLFVQAFQSALEKPQKGTAHA